MRKRPLPERKTLGTGWNLRPDTERVRVVALRVGDVVLESFDHPFRVTQINFPYDALLHGKYVWQAEDEPSWMLDRFPINYMFDRAVRGEY